MAQTRKHPESADRNVLTAARALLADPRVARRYGRSVRIDRTYDIPFLAGYSIDGGTIYIDRHLPVGTRVRGYPVTQFLVQHERVEKSLIDAMGFNYARAHLMATAVEHEFVRRAGLNPAEYEKVLAPFIKSVAREKLKRLPPDLDMTPISSTDSQSAVMLRNIIATQAVANRSINVRRRIPSRMRVKVSTNGSRLPAPHLLSSDGTRQSPARHIR